MSAEGAVLAGAPQAEGPADDRTPSVRPAASHPAETLSRLTLGGVLMGLEAVNERLAEVESLAGQASQPEPPARSLDEVLIPMSEWERTIGETPAQSARYLAIGLMADARNQAGQSTRFVRRMGDAIYTMANTFLSPLFSRGPLKPLSKGFGRLEKRGQRQVERWMALGRAEDRRSRALVQSTLHQIVDTSMDDLVENPRVQVFIQEIVQAQSQGFVDEAIEEVRERTVTGDLFLEGRVRALLKRPPRGSLPRPDFDPLSVAQKRRLPANIVKKSQLGNYAGFTSRLLAFALDLTFIALFLGLTSWLITATIQLLGLEQFFESILTADSLVGILGTLLLSMYGTLAIIIYALLSWSLTGQSIGMMLLGLRVVTVQGERLSFWRSLLRVIGYMVAAAPFFLGFLWMLGDNRRQGWHDKLAGTVVVYTWPARPDERFLVGHY